MSDIGQDIKEWWWSNMRNREHASARAFAARVRRASSDLDVAAEAQVHDLAKLLRKREDAIPLARVLAEIRENSGGPLAKRLGKGQPDAPILSHARFQRLIRCEGGALVTALRRALPMVDRTCDIARLARDFLYWTDDTRIRWTFEYYGSPPPEKNSDKADNEEPTL